MSNNGSIIELVAKGQQDEDLIDISNTRPIFRYEHHKKNKYTKGDTIFYPEGRANWGNTVRYYIERKGDLLYGLYLIVQLPKLSISNLNVTPQQDENDTNSKYRIRYADFIGNVMIEKITLYINGQLIDEQEGEYMQFYTDLYMSDWNRKAMLGLDDVFNKPNLKIQSEKIYIPLKFWFCNDIEKPLPLIALQNSEIYIDVKFRDFSNCVNILELNPDDKLFLSDRVHPEVPIESAELQANFYYLDLEERKNMATQEYEILITQAQVKSTSLASSTNLEIDFNHVVKDMIFFILPDSYKKTGQYFNFSAKSVYPPFELLASNIDYNLWLLEPKRHLLNRARLLLNGTERIEWRDAKYFYHMQNHENYQNTLQSYVYVYSFAVEPTSNLTYSGCNFSRIDNSQLQVEIKPDKFILKTTPQVLNPSDSSYHLKCYATNYNILVIKNGLGGLKYQC